jgi:hypothetical protein
MGLDATVPVGRRGDFTRIRVKGEENVDLGAVLQPDTNMAFRRALGEVSAAV